MQSMIKRKIDVSITAHVELISQLVQDAYILNKERLIDKGRRQDVFCPGNFLYHRMLRQTGHTAALKRLLSQKFREDTDAYVFGVFHVGRERQTLSCPARDFETGQQYPNPEIDTKGSTCVIDNFVGTRISEANIIVFSDTLHDPRLMEKAYAFIRENAAVFRNLALVVFLG